MLSITQRMVVGVSGTLLVSLLSMIGFSSYSLHQIANQMAERKMTKTVELSALVLTPAVLEENRDKIDQFTSIMLNSEFGAKRMCVFNRENRLLSTARCRQIDDQPLPGTVVREAPIIVDGVPRGAVGIAFDHNIIYPNLLSVERTLFLIAACIMVVAIATTVYLGALMKGSIDIIEAGLNEMKKTGVLRPLRRTPVQELQKITDSWNDIINNM